jgi:4-amino-4-deoxy-L-arabinose transferase-like glycosyltransferase
MGSLNAAVGLSALCRHAVPLAVVVGAMVRILAISVVFGWSSVPTKSDDATYRAIAESMLANGILDTHHFPVGYSLFLGVILGATGGSYTSVRLVQVLLGLLTIVVTSRITQLLYGRKAAVIAAWLVALYPPLIYINGRILSETLFVALLMGSLLLFLRSERDKVPWHYALAGALFGVACLVRSNLLPMVILIPAWLMAGPRGDISKKLWGTALSIITLGAIIIAPGLYFLATQGKFIPFATNAGQTFYGANNALADGGWIQVLDHPELLRDIAPEERASATGFSRAQYRLGFRWIQEHPGNFVRLLPMKLANAWLPGFQTAEVGSNSRVAFVLQALSLGFVLVGAIAGRLLIRPRQRDGILLIVLGAYTFMSMVFYGNPRIGLFCAPVLIVYTSSLLASEFLYRARSHARESAPLEVSTCSTSVRDDQQEAPSA